MVTRIFKRISRQTRCAAICTDRQRPRNQRQRLYVERIPNKKQQRIGSNLWEFHKSSDGTDPKILQGKVPAPGNLTEQDNTVLEEMALIPKKIGNAIEHYHFREASQLLMQLARLGNKYLADAEPWKLIKNRSRKSKNYYAYCSANCSWAEYIK